MGSLIRHIAEFRYRHLLKEANLMEWYSIMTLEIFKNLFDLAAQLIKALLSKTLAF